MNEIYVYGTGGLAQEVLWLIERINAMRPTWRIAGCIDDRDRERWNTSILEYEVRGGNDYLLSNNGCAVAVAIGNPGGRRSVFSNELKGGRLHFPVLIDPSAVKSDRVLLGDGTIICAGVLITVNVNIGEGVYINLDCTVGHGASIGDYSVLHPSVNVSGDVEIGTGCMIGTGAKILPGLTIGRNTVIGAGAVVIRSLPANCVAVGNPARVVKENVDYG